MLKTVTNEEIADKLAEAIAERARKQAERSGGPVAATVTGMEIKDISMKLELTDKDIANFTVYVKTPGGRTYFERAVKIALLKAGVGPKELKE